MPVGRNNVVGVVLRCPPSARRLDSNSTLLTRVKSTGWSLPARLVRPAADQRLSLRANMAWVLIGRGIYSGCQWGVLIVLAKIGSAELVGLYALGVAVSMPIFVFASLRLEYVHVTDARCDYRFADYLKVRIATSALALPVLIAVVLIAGYSWEKTAIILTVGASQGIMAVREMFLARMRKAERLDRQALSHVVLGIGGLCVFAAALWATRQLLAAVAALAAVRLSVMLLLDAPNAARMHLIDPEPLGRTDALPASDAVDYAADKSGGGVMRLLRLVWLAVPLGVVGVMVALTESIPRYLVEHYMDEAALGYFAAIASIPMIGYVVTEAAAQSASPRLARYYISNRPAYVALAFKLVALALALGLSGVSAAWLLGPWLLGLLFTPEYAPYASLFVWLMIVGGLWYLWGFCEVCLTAARYFRTQIPVNVAVMLTVLAAGLVLVPRYGMPGAAWAMIGAAGVGLCGTAAAVVYAASRPAAPRPTPAVEPAS